MRTKLFEMSLVTFEKYRAIKTSFDFVIDVPQNNYLLYNQLQNTYK